MTRQESAPPSPDRDQRRRRFSRTLAYSAGLETIKVFTLVLLIQLVIFGSAFTVNASRDYGFDLVMLFPIFRITFAYCLYYTIPISILFATGLVFGRMIADREIASLRSFGVSHLEMLVVPGTLGLVLATVCFFINGFVIPEIRFAKDNLGRLLLDQLQYMEEGYDRSFFLDDQKKNKIVIQSYRSGVLSTILLFAEEPERIFGKVPGKGAKDAATDDDQRPAAGSQTLLEARAFPFLLIADEGEVATDDSGKVSLELRDVSIYYDDSFRGGEARGVDKPLEDFLQNAHFSRLRVPIDDFERKKRVIKAMPNPMLRRFIGEQLEEHERLARISDPDESTRRRCRRALSIHRKAKALYQRRLTYAGICWTFPVVMALIALSLNSMNRLLPFFVGAMVCCAIFFPLEVQGYKLARTWNLAALEHLGNVALLLLALVLFLRLEKVFCRSRRSPGGVATAPADGARPDGNTPGGPQ